MIYYKQEENRSCGPACVRMVFSKLGKDITEDFLIKKLKSNHKIWTKTKNIIRFFRKKRLDFFCKTNWSIKAMNHFLDTHIILIRYNLPKNEEDHYALFVWLKHDRIHLWDPWYGKNHTYSINYFNKHRKSTWEWYEKWFIAIKKNQNHF